MQGCNTGAVFRQELMGGSYSGVITRVGRFCVKVKGVTAVHVTRVWQELMGGSMPYFFELDGKDNGILKRHIMNM